MICCCCFFAQWTPATKTMVKFCQCASSVSGKSKLQQIDHERRHSCPELKMKRNSNPSLSSCIDESSAITSNVYKWLNLITSNTLSWMLWSIVCCENLAILAIAIKWPYWNIISDKLQRTIEKCIYCQTQFVVVDKIECNVQHHSRVLLGLLRWNRSTRQMIILINGMLTVRPILSQTIIFIMKMIAEIVPDKMVKYPRLYFASHISSDRK